METMYLQNRSYVSYNIKSSVSTRDQETVTELNIKMNGKNKNLRVRLNLFFVKVDFLYNKDGK